jgi:hypothetical protein
MRRLLIAAAVASTALSSIAPAKAYPFKMDVDSIAYWLTNLRYSNDPTFRKRIHSLYNCKHGPSYSGDQYAGRLECDGYIDISDGTYPNGTRCEMEVTMMYDSQTAIKDNVRIRLKNEYCYKGYKWLHWQ